MEEIVSPLWMRTLGCLCSRPAKVKIRLPLAATQSAPLAARGLQGTAPLPPLKPTTGSAAVRVQRKQEPRHLCAWASRVEQRFARSHSLWPINRSAPTGRACGRARLDGPERVEPWRRDAEETRPSRCAIAARRPCEGWRRGSSAQLGTLFRSRPRNLDLERGNDLHRLGLEASEQIRAPLCPGAAHSPWAAPARQVAAFGGQAESGVPT